MLIPIHFCTLPWSQGGSRTNRICSILQRERRRHKVERQRAHSDPTIQDCTVQDLTRKHSLNGPIHSRSVCIWLGRENQKQKHHGNIMQNCVNPEWGCKGLWDYKSSEGSPMCRKGSRGGRPHSSSPLTLSLSSFLLELSSKFLSTNNAYWTENSIKASFSQKAHFSRSGKGSIKVGQLSSYPNNLKPTLRACAIQHSSHMWL